MSSARHDFFQTLLAVLRLCLQLQQFALTNNCGQLPDHNVFSFFPRLLADAHMPSLLPLEVVAECHTVFGPAVTRITDTTLVMSQQGSILDRNKAAEAGNVGSHPSAQPQLSRDCAGLLDGENDIGFQGERRPLAPQAALLNSGGKRLSTNVVLRGFPPF